MSAERRFDAAFLGAGGLVLLVAAFAMPRASDSEAALRTTVAMGSFSAAEGLVLLVAGILALRSGQRLEQGTPARLGWTLLGAGLLVLAGGETIEAVYALRFGEIDPFPSLADLFFLGSYPLLTVAFVLFLRAYGLLAEPDPRDRTFAGMAGFALLALGSLVAYPVLHADTGFAERAISLSYVVLDLGILAPLLLLLRLTWRFRGGTIWKIWAGILAGFLITSLADVLFAYFENRAGAVATLSMPQMHFLSEVLFLLSYLAIARGTLQQDRLLRA